MKLIAPFAKDNISLSNRNIKLHSLVNHRCTDVLWQSNINENVCPPFGAYFKHAKKPVSDMFQEFVSMSSAKIGKKMANLGTLVYLYRVLLIQKR